MKRLKPQEVRVIRSQPSIMLNYTRQSTPVSSTIRSQPSIMLNYTRQAVPVSPTGINMWTLADGIIVRREWFGCLICNTATRDFYQFNDDAFEIIRRFKTPNSAKSIRYQLEKDGYEIEETDLYNFLQLLVDRSILVESNQPQDSLFYFENREYFRRDCLAAPTSVTIYLTEYCPKTCTHCVVRSSPSVDRSGELTVAEWFTVLQKLRDFGVCALVFTGGEPLTKEGVFDILRYADKLKFSISLLTDFDGLNEDHIAQLKTLRRLCDIQISLDGGTEATHDSIRGRGAFRKALRRMALLRDHGMRYTVSTTVCQRNIEELDQIVEICREYKATYLYINPLAPYGRAKELMRSELLSDEQLRWLGQRYLELVADGIVSAGNPFWDEQVDRRTDPNFHPFEGALTAVSIGTYNFSIGSHGECYLDSKMKSEGLLYLGNALRDDFESMWYSPKLDPLRAHFSPDRFTYIDQAKVPKEIE
jgi:MoaA/NifB/PqqE/SkfB family radical SAM enzyme